MTTLKQIRDRVTTRLLDSVPETNALIDMFINDAIREAEEMHNFREMEATLSINTVEGSRSLAALPADWKERRDPPWRVADDGATKEIAWAPSQSEMIRRYDDDSDLDTGPPQFVLEINASLEVYPFPDGNSDYVDGEYRIRVPYWAYTAELVNDGDTNYFTNKAEKYLEFFAAMEGFLLNQDDRQAAIYQGRAQQQLRRFINQDKGSRLPRRLTLRPRRDVYGRGKGLNRS